MDEGPRPRVEVWVADTDAWDEGHARSLLDEGERQRADRFARAEDGRRFAVAHAALRRVLGRHLGVGPAAVAFAQRPCLRCGEPHGKPALADRPAPEFNLSHSGRLVAVAVCEDLPVGVDVQEVGGADHRRLARRFYAAAEHEDVAGRPEPDATQRFHQLWARKEAVLKATGEGIGAGLDRVDVREGDDGRVVVARPGPRPGPDLTVRDVEAPDGFRAAVAAPGDGWGLVVRALPG